MADLCAECLARGSEELCARRRHHKLCPIDGTWAVSHLVDQVREAIADTEKAGYRAEQADEECANAERERDRAIRKAEGAKKELLDEIRAAVAVRCVARGQSLSALKPEPKDYEEAIESALKKL